MQIRILGERDVRALITLEEAIAIQAEAFLALAEGRSVEGLRRVVTSEDPAGVMIFNPSVLKGGAGYGVKVVSDFYDNERRGVPRMTALVVLFDGVSGRPRTVMEAGHLTDLRTGAGTALAARHLARPDSRRLALFGAGRVARNQVEAIAAVLPIEEVAIATRTEARGRAFIDRMAAPSGPVRARFRLVATPREAVAEADVVVCATTAAAPVFAGRDLRPGTFVAAAGAYAPDRREVDSETIRRAAKRVIDSKPDCLPNAGDLQTPIREGLIVADDVAGIADLLAGRRPGRTDAVEITYYKSSGVPIQDLFTARRIETNAEAQGIGTLIEIGGDDD
ncbi:MAG: ornithine cyclodeaminase family protein [Alphaproteobacteria bacterium]|nr:ornithine cyclodeaminase family protein [Alphaproteobacteria bacterium]